MDSVRLYGKKPFKVVLLHGGPGAAGEMAPVARELADRWGVLEPFQSAKSIDGQVEELRSILKKNANPPITLIGFSWGAWLGFILSAHYPEFGKKLILIGSGPFEEKYASRIQEIRLSRLTDVEKTEVESLFSLLDNPQSYNKDAAFKRMGELLAKADSYDPIPSGSGLFESFSYSFEIHRCVWKEAAELRNTGRLLALGNKIKCPVTAIHGDWDPHPAEGVQKPLSKILREFRFIPLKHCGHKPWIERRAEDQFFKILDMELTLK
jgi:pimeloyl-ACP methyl ester carboxylesterase